MRAFSVRPQIPLSFRACRSLASVRTDREAFLIYESLEPAQQVTAQTARTLVEGGDTGQDSVEVWELSKFVMHFVADILADAASLDDDPADQGPKVRHTPLAPW